MSHTVWHAACVSADTHVSNCATDFSHVSMATKSAVYVSEEFSLRWFCVNRSSTSHFAPRTIEQIESRWRGSSSVSTDSLPSPDFCSIHHRTRPLGTPSFIQSHTRSLSVLGLFCPVKAVQRAIWLSFFNLFWMFDFEWCNFFNLSQIGDRFTSQCYCIFFSDRLAVLSMASVNPPAELLSASFAINFTRLFILILRPF